MLDIDACDFLALWSVLSEGNAMMQWEEEIIMSVLIKASMLRLLLISPRILPFLGWSFVLLQSSIKC